MAPDADSLSETMALALAIAIVGDGLLALTLSGD
jgi:hypothetical protein